MKLEPGKKYPWRLSVNWWGYAREDVVEVPSRDYLILTMPKVPAEKYQAVVWGVRKIRQARITGRTP